MLIDRSFRTLLSREVLRFTRVWMQTIIPPLLTSLLYVVVFGVALGRAFGRWTAYRISSTSCLVWRS